METGLTKKEFLSKIFKEAGCVADDFFKHKHYTIITRSGIEKIQAYNDIKVAYTLERCEPNFCVVKAFCSMGDKNTNTWYVAEMAEKRAFSRGVLKVMGLYEHGIMGQDESEDFKKG
jgi:hypothetical protein